MIIPNAAATIIARGHTVEIEVTLPNGVRIVRELSFATAAEALLFAEALQSEGTR